MDLKKIQNAGNEVSEVLEKYGFYELEALTVLESVKISIEASIMKKAMIPHSAEAHGKK